MSEEVPGYRAVHWEPLDVISDEVMDRMSSNIQAIHDHLPRVMWTHSNVRRDQGTKIISGKKLIARSGKTEDTANVSFGPFFSGGCQPNITIGINARHQQNLYCTFSGRPGSGLTPNGDGFVIHLQVAKEDGEKKKIARNVWVHWTAVGY